MTARCAGRVGRVNARSPPASGPCEARPGATTPTLDRTVAAPPPTEHVVLLDERGAAVGTAPKGGVHHAATPLHLAFSCYLVDDDGRVLLTRRAEGKPTWPGVWTNSCCGHPRPGEAIADAVVRRLRDELGASVRQVELIDPRFRYRAVMRNGVVENEVCPVFRAWSGGEVTLDDREVAEARWVPWAEVLALLDDGPGELSPWFRQQVAGLRRLGDDPRRWPVGDEAELPPAARPGPPPGA